MGQAEQTDDLFDRGPLTTLQLGLAVLVELTLGLGLAFALGMLLVLVVGGMALAAELAGRFFRGLLP